MKSRMLATALVLLVVITVGALPAAAAKPKPKPQATAQVGTTVSVEGAGEIAKWLLGKAGEVGAKEGIGFVFAQIGLSALFPSETDRQLADIKRQLDRIQEQLAGLKTTVEGLISDVAENNLDQKIGAIQEKWNQVDDLYQFTFLPVMEAGQAYRTALDKGVKEDIYKARGALKAARAAFINKYEGFPYGTINTDIHDYLVPGAKSVLAAKGRVMLLQGNGRYLTPAQSQALRKLYDNLAAQEAVAAWLKMERYLPAVDWGEDNKQEPKPLTDADFVLFNRARLQFLNSSVDEFVNLPPTIPADVVVDAGPSVRRAVSDAPMWTPGSTNALLKYQPNVKGPGTVYDAEKGLNDTNRTGFTDWEVPSQKQLTDLLAGNVPAKPVNDFLVGLHPNNDAWKLIKGNPNWQYIWSDTETVQKVSCYPTSGYVYNVSVPTKMAVATANGQWGPRPKMVSPGGKYQSPRPVCDKYVADTWAGKDTTGAFLATRSTGKMDIDYMAQGLGPRIRPQANLRDADLSGYALVDVNMNNADLTRANLQGANLTGANLAGAKLDGVRSGQIIGKPDKLPPGWDVISGYLIGPGADLRDANINDADLSDVDLRGVITGQTSCVCVFPSPWQLGAGYFIGPRVQLAGADLHDLVLEDADFTGADLRGANFRGADMKGANFREADLTEADLRGASFVGANFTGADLTNVRGADTDLTDATLTDTTLSAANFSGATFDGVVSGGVQVTSTGLQLPARWRLMGRYLVGPGADLSDMRGAGADFTSVDLSFADLSGANLRNAVFRNATLFSVVLTDANIDGADFTTNDEDKLAALVSGDLHGKPVLPAGGRFRIEEGYFIGPRANLEGANFSPKAQLGVALTNTNFARANLRGVDFTNASLNSAILQGADLTNAKMQNANLSNAYLRGVQSTWITGTPAALPSGWQFINGAFVGLQARTAGIFIAGKNLTGMDLRGMDFGDSGMSVGTNLTNANLEGATFGRYFTMSNTIFSNTRCPNGVVQSTPCGLQRGTQPAVIDVVPNSSGFQVSVSPKLTAQWKVMVEFRFSNGGLLWFDTVTTAGTNNTVQINVAQTLGMRVVVLPQNGYLSAESAVYTKE